MLVELYRKLNKIPFVRAAGETYLKIEDYFGTKDARKRLQKLHNKKNNPEGVIHVGFLVQDPNVWNKNRALYQAMQKEKQIKLSVICVPDPFDEDTGSTYDWFCGEGYDCIDARVGNGPWNTMGNQGDWIDLRELKLDYLFYGQPYDAYLPVNLKTKTTSKFTKLCISSYGVPTTMNLLVEVRPRSFYRYMYFSFAQIEDEKQYGLFQFGEGQNEGYQRVENYGPLVMDDFVKAREHKTPSWDFSKNEIRGMWTPRWTMDEKIGGSNFFRYKDFLFAYAEKHEDVDLLFRPHPMALDNFLRIGKMTREEVEDFRRKCKEMKNVSLDTDREYGYTFWNSSFLVTDLSSIIVEYFITGKPIIFCKTENDQQEYLEFFQKILDSAYLVRNQEELEEALNLMRDGKDPKKTDRERLIKELFGEYIGQVAERIVQEVVKDYKGE